MENFAHGLSLTGDNNCVSARLGFRRRTNLAWMSAAVLGAFAPWSPSFAAPPVAAEPSPFSITPLIAVKPEYDTNPSLLLTNQKPLYGATLAPSVTLKRRSSEYTFVFGAELDSARFNLPQYSSTDAHSNALIGRTWSRGFARLSGTMDYDTTRTSELETSGEDIAGVRHTGFTISPTAGYNITPLDNISVQGTYQRSDYGKSDLFESFESYEVSPTITHNISPRVSVSLVVQAVEFDTLSGRYVSQSSIGPGVGWQYNIRPNLTAVLTVGDYTRVSERGIAGGGNSYYFNGSLSYTGLKNALSLTILRDLAATSTSLSTVTTGVKVSETLQFNSRLSALIKASYSVADVAPPNILQQHSFLEIAPSLKYSFSQNLSGSLSYRFRQKEEYGTALIPTSNAVLLSISYSLYPAAPVAPGLGAAN